ncbi:hypothetical protein EJB05_27744, partial [Eragrostis curvula]
MSPPESGECAGDPCSVADCLRLMEQVPAAAASAPAFRRHWPSVSPSLATLSTALSSPAFPPAAPLLAPLAAALSALLSVAADAGRLGTSTPSRSSPPPPPRSPSLPPTRASSLRRRSTEVEGGAVGGGDGGGIDGVVSRLRMGSAASRAAALEDLAAAVETLPASSAAAAVSARAVSLLAAFASSDPARPFLAQESSTILPHLCRALESGAGAAAEHACAALLPLTAASRDAAAAVAARGGVAALLGACAAGTPAAQAAAAGVLRNLAAFPDVLPYFRDEGNAVPLLLQLVALGTPRARELALGCLQNLTAAGDGDVGDEAQRLKVDAFQDGALACVRDFLDGARGDEPALAPALGLLRNMATFRYVAEIAASAGFVALVAAALVGSDRSATRAEAATALAELCHVNSKNRKELGDSVVPRLVWMLEAKPAAERDAAARALAALLASGGGGGGHYRKLFRKDERGVVNAVQLLDPAHGVDRRFPVAVLLAVAQSRRCRKQMVAAGACGFVQGLVDAEVDGAKKLADCLGKGKMLGVFQGRDTGRNSEFLCDDHHQTVCMCCHDHFPCLKFASYSSSSVYDVL